MKLELKHLAPYLPYGLKMISGHYLIGLTSCKESEYETHDQRMMLLSETKDGKIDWEAHANMDVPYLRPMSDLTKEIEVNGEVFVPIEKLFGTKDKDATYQMWINGIHAIYHRFDYSIEIYQKLLEWHFDVFGLIEQGLAIDINTL